MSNFKKKLFDRLRTVIGTPEKYHEKHTVLQSRLIAQVNRNIVHLKDLSEVEFSGFSQWGEDGIIDWLIRKLPGIPQIFVEFGVEDYRESNTRLLLNLRNWRGLVIDGSIDHINSIKNQDVSWRFDLMANCAFIDRENINHLIKSSGIIGEIGLLSVDIDGNDYWVWQAIDIVSPVVVVCEYNAVFGDVHQISVPYRADFQRTKAHYSNLYFGTSLAALIELGKSKGYIFVGTNSAGCNAFFVRNDFASAVTDSITEIRAFPSSFREARDQSGQLTLASGNERLACILQLPVYDFSTQSVKRLEEMGNLYSANWLQQS